MRPLAVICSAALLAGCAPSVDESPAIDQIVGAWEMSKLDASASAYLARSGARVDAKEKPRLEVRANGTLSVARLPLDIDKGRAITADATGKWQLLSPQSKNDRWKVMLILSEPKRGLSYDLRKEGSGFLLRGSFDPEDPGGIEFRRLP